MNRFWKILRRAFFVLRLTVWLSGLALVLGYAYLYLFGVPPSVCAALKREMAGHGIAATFDGIRLELPANFIARNVTLANSRTPDRPVVRAGRVGLDLKLMGAWRGEFFGSSLELMEGTLSLPVDSQDPQAERIDASKLNGRVYLGSDNKLVVDQVTAEVFRCRLILQGEIRLAVAPPSAVAQPKPVPTTEERDRRIRLLRNVTKELRSLQFAQLPSFSLMFGLDLEDPSASWATLRIEAGPVTHPKLAVEGVSGRLRYAAEKLYVDRLETTLGGRKLKIEGGYYDFKQNLSHATVTSSVDPKIFATFLPAEARQKLMEWHYDQNPLLNVTADWAADRLEVKSFSLGLAGGQLRIAGYYDFKAGEARADLESDLDLKQLTVFMPPGWQRVMGDWQWKKNPEIRFSLFRRESTPNFPTIELGRVAISEASFRGIGIKRAAFTGELRNDVVSLRDAVIDLQPPAERPELKMVLRGNYSCQLTKQDFVFEGVESSAYPVLLKPLFSTNVTGVLLEYQFELPPTIRARWTGNWKDAEAFACDGHLDFGALAWRGLKVNSGGADFRYEKQVLRFRNVLFRRPEGELHADYQTDFKEADFSASLQGTLDLNALRPVMGDHQKLLDRYRFETPATLDIRTISGHWRRLEGVTADGIIRTGAITTELGKAVGLTAHLTIDPATIHISDLLLRVPSGEARARLNYDRLHERLELSCNDCELQPIEVAQLVGTNFVKAISPYSFPTPPKLIHAKALFDFQKPAATTWSLTLNAPVVNWWRLQSKGLTTQISFTNQVLTLGNFNTEATGFYGGRLRDGKGVFDLGPASMVYDVSFALENVANGGDLLRAIFRDAKGNAQVSDAMNQVTGSVHGNAHVAGTWADYNSIHGNGEMHVVSGQLRSIPIFGGISELIGMFHRNKFTNPTITEMDTTFAIDKGYVYLPDPNNKDRGDISIRATPHSITGRGRWQIQGNLDFVFRVEPMGEAGVIKFLSPLFYPLAKPLEMELSGPISDHKWRPKWLWPNMGSGEKK